MDPSIYKIEQVSPKYTKTFLKKNHSNGSSVLSNYSLKSSSFQNWCQISFAAKNYIHNLLIHVWNLCTRYQ